ncbi:MAG: Mevalonate kinase [Myxococcaceae bacterium]|nr:Mevalonate kinase [Myxococcaceae bacterium]
MGSVMEEQRAWGKVILLGEHAVVYGVPAIAVGIERGAHAVATALPAGSTSRLVIEGFPIEIVEDDAERDLARAFRAILEPTRAAHAVTTSWHVAVRADLPPGGGLGCSAALGVAIARALDPEADDAQIRERAMQWEKVFHGNPSGIDTAVALSGGSIFFEDGKITPLLLPPEGFTLCVGHSGTASSTKSMVEAVARMRARRPEIVEKTFVGIRSLVENARLALEAGDITGLGRLMDLNQMLLAGLFLSTQELEQMCSLARDAGALGAKLTGAGGGGCVVALVPNAEIAEAVLAAWKGEGFLGFSTRVAPSEERRSLTPEPEPEQSATP